MEQDLIENSENKLERTAPQGASYLMLWLNEIPRYDFSKIKEDLQEDFNIQCHRNTLAA